MALTSGDSFQVEMMSELTSDDQTGILSPIPIMCTVPHSPYISDAWKYTKILFAFLIIIFKYLLHAEHDVIIYVGCKEK